MNCQYFVDHLNSGYLADYSSTPGGEKETLNNHNKLSTWRDPPDQYPFYNQFRSWISDLAYVLRTISAHVAAS